MTADLLIRKAEAHLQRLCLDIPTRPVGSQGNRAATAFVAERLAAAGFDVQTPEFDCLHWTHGDVILTTAGESFVAYPSPYSLGCTVRARLTVASTVNELQALETTDKLLLLHGEIAAEQLMPKSFPFYNPEHHRRVVSLLEERAPAAIIAATSRNPELAGGLYPFPLIEDGDFDIPSVYMKDVDGERLASHAASEVSLTSDATRFPAKACNVIARKGNPQRRVIFLAHIDAKDGTPGALDNGTGVVALLLLAELLAEDGLSSDEDRGLGVEILAVNGEDYYGAPGQIHYLAQHSDRLDEIVLAINLDVAGYREGIAAYSLYACPDEMASQIRGAFSGHSILKEGEQWYQSDHMVFVMNGRPAVAITSEHFVALSAEITHTPQDHPDLVDYGKVVEIALALSDVYREMADLDNDGPRATHGEIRQR